MHGVGHVFVEKSFERFGFNPFTPVKEQQDPDPEFPTVQFPNPEEAGTPRATLRLRTQRLTIDSRSTGM
jgi:phosphomannomutase